MMVDPKDKHPTSPRPYLGPVRGTKKAPPQAQYSTAYQQSSRSNLARQREGGRPPKETPSKAPASTSPHYPVTASETALPLTQTGMTQAAAQTGRCEHLHGHPSARVPLTPGIGGEKPQVGPTCPSTGIRLQDGQWGQGLVGKRQGVCRTKTPPNAHHSL